MQVLSSLRACEQLSFFLAAGFFAAGLRVVAGFFAAGLFAATLVFLAAGFFAVAFFAAFAMN